VGICGDDCPHCAKEKLQEWDGKCHGCQAEVQQAYVARIGPYWICDSCIAQHFPNEQYSVNQAAEILERLRGFR
jgi:hypothetical protein